jgi:hypothetical protein
MLADDTLVWQVFAPLPSSVRLEYADPTGEHPLTPARVRERYRERVSNGAIIVWKDANEGACGFRSGIDEVAWALAAVEGIELCFQRQAKGPGCIALRVCLKENSADLAVLASRFDEQLLVWFRRLCQVVKEVIPCAIKELDEGYDV